MWLYIGIRAEFINNALWRRSVGGVVANILLFIRLASVFLIVSSIVLSIVFPSACRLQVFQLLFGSGLVLFPVRCLYTGLLFS